MYDIKLVLSIRHFALLVQSYFTAYAFRMYDVPFTLIILRVLTLTEQEYFISLSGDRYPVVVHFL